MKTLLALTVVTLVACTSGEATKPARTDTPPMAHTGVVSEDAFAALHELTDQAAPAPRGETIALSDGTRAYLSLPPGRSAPLPAVIVVHEWWGLNAHIKHWSDRLAAEGYAAVAVDLYGGEVATERPEAMKLMKAVIDAEALATLKAAASFLRSDPRVSAAHTAAIGWCFGGGWSLQAALNDPELTASVVYYGRLETDPERLRRIRGPILGVFATRDAAIPPASVDAFEQGLGAAEIEHIIHRYDAEHAFANPSSGRYNRAAAADAWSQVRAFLARTLR